MLATHSATELRRHDASLSACCTCVLSPLGPTCWLWFGSLASLKETGEKQSEQEGLRLQQEKQQIKQQRMWTFLHGSWELSALLWGHFTERTAEISFWKGCYLPTIPPNYPVSSEWHNDWLDMWYTGQVSIYCRLNPVKIRSVTEITTCNVSTAVSTHFLSWSYCGFSKLSLKLTIKLFNHHFKSELRLPSMIRWELLRLLLDLKPNQCRE